MFMTMWVGYAIMKPSKGNTRNPEQQEDIMLVKYDISGKVDYINNPYRAGQIIDTDYLKLLRKEAKLWKSDCFLAVYKNGGLNIVGYKPENRETILEALQAESIRVLDMNDGYTLRLNSMDNFARDLGWILEFWGQKREICDCLSEIKHGLDCRLSDNMIAIVLKEMSKKEIEDILRLCEEYSSEWNIALSQKIRDVMSRMKKYTVTITYETGEVENLTETSLEVFYDIRDWFTNTSYSDMPREFCGVILQDKP